MQKRFISFSNGKAKFGLDRNAMWVIDLQEKKQGLRTNPVLSIFETSHGFNWEDLNWSETKNGPFICDDDDNYLWLCESTNIENGDDYSTQEEMIDAGQAEVCINIEDLTFYDKGNGCYYPIA